MMKDALRSAYDTYADMLYRLALAKLQHCDDALDAVQDVFVKFASMQKTFRDKDHERAWFIRVLINHCHDLHRKRVLRNHLSLEDIPHESTDNIARPPVLEMVDALPEAYKDVVVLHHLEGFSVRETASILRLSESAVKMRLSRAREALKATLKEEGYHV